MIVYAKKHIDSRCEPYMIRMYELIILVLIIHRISLKRTVSVSNILTTKKRDTRKGDRHKKPRLDKRVGRPDRHKKPRVDNRRRPGDRHKKPRLDTRRGDRHKRNQRKGEIAGEADIRTEEHRTILQSNPEREFSQLSNESVHLISADNISTMEPVELLRQIINPSGNETKVTE